MNITQLKDDVDFLCGSTSATYPDATKIRNFNIAYNDVARLIWDSAGGWQYDDSNKTDFGIATTNLVHSQQDYSLPTTAQRLERVEVKDSQGSWWKLKQIDSNEIDLALPEYQETDGLPTYYDVLGSSIFLYPQPSSAYCTLTSGLQVYFDRNVTEIATTATTSSPGFATPFHRILSYAAAIDFTQEPNQRQFLVIQKDRLEKGLIKFYSSRNIERQTRIVPHNKKYWRQYT